MDEKMFTLAASKAARRAEPGIRQLVPTSGHKESAKSHESNVLNVPTSVFFL
jgi:hypothetical protein